MLPDPTAGSPNDPRPEPVQRPEATRVSAERVVAMIADQVEARLAPALERQVAAGLAELRQSIDQRPPRTERAMRKGGQAALQPAPDSVPLDEHRAALRKAHLSGLCKGVAAGAAGAEAWERRTQIRDFVERTVVRLLESDDAEPEHGADPMGLFGEGSISY